MFTVNAECTLLLLKINYIKMGLLTTISNEFKAAIGYQKDFESLLKRIKKDQADNFERQKELNVMDVFGVN